MEEDEVVEWFDSLTSLSLFMRWNLKQVSMTWPRLLQKLHKSSSRLVGALSRWNMMGWDCATTPDGSFDEMAWGDDDDEGVR